MNDDNDNDGKYTTGAARKRYLTTYQNRLSLEGLPVELHICILFKLQDLDSLRSLVHASPVCYQAYRLVRDEVLLSILRSSYDGHVDISDAVAAVRSRGLYAIKPSNRAKIIALLDSRRRSEEIRHLGLSSGPFPDQPATVDETIRLLHLHRMATFLLDDYSRTARCPEWMPPEKWKNEILPLRLSRTEQRRFFRAFYRMQIWGNVFGHIELPLDADRPEKENYWFSSRERVPLVFEEEEVWRLFFGTMAPWEVDEIACFWRHCYHRWEEPYFEISDSLLSYGVTFMSDLPPDEQPPLNRHWYDCDDLRIREDENRESLACMGPSFLVKMLRERDFRTRRDLLLANTISWHHFFHEYWPRPDDGPGALPLLYPADKFNFGTDFNGLKEFLNTLRPHQRPNIAWTQLWLGAGLDFPEVFVDMFCYAEPSSNWDWGFALWSDERLMEWGALDQPCLRRDVFTPIPEGL
ncbi:hypothetical protein CNMCM6106_008586 [Aspergillus hiratsukae]|uniref:F-box domain-containing protein n=1 Tax=Aspergillus hiratsukae TaxID=1194566 RepID=A0A8H6QLE7_9EURO|nr:hypothetical protein CNMCM6106_008586 [Aspergillus hiratsukae]